MMPKVSILIPTYNRVHLLPRALDSVWVQDFADYEVVIVDDGSTDTTTRYLASLTDSRIRIVTHGTNRGITSARNTCLDAARGEWIAFLSSDDELTPNALSRMLAVTRIDSELSGVFCNSQDVGCGGLAGTGLSEGYLAQDELMLGESWCLLRRDAIGAVRMIEGLNTFESEWLLRVMARMKRYFIPDALYRYHTEAEDRVTLSYERGTNALSIYEQWGRVFDENPTYLSARVRAGLGNAYPEVYKLFLANRDLARANSLYWVGYRAGFLQLQDHCMYTPAKRRWEDLKRLIVRVLRKLHLYPGAPRQSS